MVGHPALVITRNVEWGTVIFGFEQANKYTICDQEGNVVALLAEELGSFGKEVGRQLLRTRRPFTATVFSPDGTIDHHQARLVHACFKTCRLGSLQWLAGSKSYQHDSHVMHSQCNLKVYAAHAQTHLAPALGTKPCVSF